MQGMKIFCSIVIMLSAIAAMIAAVQTTSQPQCGSLTVAAAIIFSGGLVSRCMLEARVRLRDDA